MNDYKSLEELHFSWYLDELLKYNIIEEYKYEPKSFVLAEKKTYIKHIQLKTKVNKKEYELLSDIVYTPDFLIKWNTKYNGIFYRLISDGIYFNSPYFFALGHGEYYHFSLIEIKANFDRHNEVRMFTYHQKWLYDQREIYVQLVKVPKVFKDTFTPSRYLLTDKTQKQRSINFPIKTLDNYLNMINKSQ